MLPAKPFKRLMKHYGAYRVSDDAARYMANYTEKVLSQLISKAAKLADHAGRKTILLDDIKLARKQLNL